MKDEVTRAKIHNGRDGRKACTQLVEVVTRKAKKLPGKPVTPKLADKPYVRQIAEPAQIAASCIDGSRGEWMIFTFTRHLTEAEKCALVARLRLCDECSLFICTKWRSEVQLRVQIRLTCICENGHSDAAVVIARELLTAFTAVTTRR